MVLLKARVITGDKEFSILTQNMLNQLAYKKSLLDIAQSKAELAKIQQKFADEKGHESENEYNLKTGPGGTLYLEMLTRNLQLKH